MTDQPTPYGTTPGGADGASGTAAPEGPARPDASRHDQWLRDTPSLLARAFAPVAGYGVTISSMFRPVVTERYPFEPAQVMPRFHGRHRLNRYDDGLEKCIGCELCAWACPADAIYVEAASNEPGAQYSPGERYGRVYQINYLRCIFCGMCIEACPTRALTMSNDFDELVGPNRTGLIYGKEDLLVPVPSGGLAAPHPMVEGTEDGDYYRGAVTGPTQAQIDWVRANRPEDPTLATARPAADSGDQPRPAAQARSGTGSAPARARVKEAVR